MNNNHYKSEFSESWLSNGVVHQVISPKVKQINLKIAKQLVADRSFAMGGVGLTLPVFVIINNAKSVDAEAKAYYKTKEAYQNISAIAMLIDNHIARLVGRLIFIINPPSVPTALFNSEEKAFDWLKNYQNLN